MDGSEASRAGLLRRLAIRGHLPGDVDPLLDELIIQGCALSVGDSVILTEAGTRAAQQDLLLGEQDPRRASLEARMPHFDVLDQRVREVCTAWQLLPDGTPNTHDAGYDETIGRRLADVHHDALELIVHLGSIDPHLGEYAELLSVACDAFLAGDTTMLASPVRASYHTVWMWLHQELRLLLGLPPGDDPR